ncbi:hypothetical protein KRMM14A1004_48620 [Krasilnikovia sp. MM14-A1004]
MASPCTDTARVTAAAGSAVSVTAVTVAAVVAASVSRTRRDSVDGREWCGALVCFISSARPADGHRDAVAVLDGIRPCPVLPLPSAGPAAC